MRLACLRELRRLAKTRELFDPRRPAPLGIGLHRELLPRLERAGIARTVGRWWLGWWTRRIPYLLAVRNGGWRYGLGGERTEQITDAERQHARRMIQDLRR